MAKTFLIQWLFLLRSISRYGANNIDKMALNVTPEQLACITSVLATVTECITAFGARPIE